MKREEGKSKNKNRKKDINFYCIFSNNEEEQLQNKISIIFKEYLDSLYLNTQK